MHGRLYKRPQFRDSLMDILDTAIKVDGAAKGNLQLFNQLFGGLGIVAQRGFNLPFLQLFNLVRADDPCPCGRAFRHKRRIIIPDITTDLLYWPYRSIARANGYQAVQSTPIIGMDGSVKGILSTHFQDIHYFSIKAMVALDDCARRIARVLDDHETEEYPLIKNFVNDTLVWS